MSEQQGSRTDQAIAKMARRLELRRKGDRKLPAITDQSAAPQQWWGVAKAACALADSVSGVPIAGPAIELLKAISRVEDAQTAMLAAIGRDVRLIREGPFHAAQEHLATAHRYKPQHPDYKGELKDAKKSLLQAWGQAASEEEKSLIRYHLGLVALLQYNDTAEAEDRLRKSYKQEAEYQLSESYRHCLSVVGTLAEDLKKTSVTEHLRKNLNKIAEEHKGATEASALGILGAAGVSGTALLLAPLLAGALVVNSADKLKCARRNYRVGSTLESYAPFVNAVVRTLNAVLGNAAQPGLTFRGDTTTGYQLEWAALEN
jgi:hypothetical protein